MVGETASARTASASHKVNWLALLGLVVGCAWSYWPTLLELWRVWQTNPDYSAGQLVPLVAAYVLWSDRKALREIDFRPCWWGFAVVVFAQAVRLLGVLLSYGSIVQYSLVLTIAGVALWVLGCLFARREVWVGAFLLLLVPLPHRLHTGALLELQRFASSSAVFGLELLGYLVGREGNVLRLGDQGAIAVAEACSGLRMLTAFVLVGATLAFVVRRPAWHKAVLVASTIPVGVLANTLRLIATVIVYDKVGPEVGERFFHDYAGIAMVPLALAFMVVELWVLRWIDNPGEGSMSAARCSTSGVGRRRQMER